MANWNSGYIFNARAEHGGFFWNGAAYVLLLRLNEVLRFNDKITQNLARLVLLDKMNLVEESLIQTALFKEKDMVYISDDMTYYALFETTDKLGITDDFSALLVLAALNDKVNIIDQARMLAAKIETDEIFKANDEITLKSFVDTIDKFGLSDLSKVAQAIFRSYDAFGMTDAEPKQAVSDFVVGVIDDYDNAYDWILPFGMKVDWEQSTMNIMPEASLTTIEMPGIDGSIIEDTVYKDRLFQIVAFSEQGLTIQQKEDLKSKITEILNVTKHNTKKLTIQTRSASFDVKYDGQAIVKEGPSYVKATIPFRTPPYGYDMFDNEVVGNGLISNSGVIATGVKHTIIGPVTNPSFTLGERSYSWSGTVPSGSKLIIDHGMMTCYIENQNGVKTNALSKLSGTFYKIPANTSVVFYANPNYASQITTTWKNKVIW